MNQYTIILNYLKQVGDWIEEYKIRAIHTPDGHWIGARGDRNVRDLIKWGAIDSAYRGKFRIVRYNEKKDFLFREENKKKELTSEQILLEAIK